MVSRTMEHRHEDQRRDSHPPVMIQLLTKYVRGPWAIVYVPSVL